MAQISFDQIDAYERNRGGSTGRTFSFFALKNHGDKALVRILYDDVSEFMFYSYHQVDAQNRTFRINCLRTDADNISSCPLCASGSKTKTSFFIPMVQYSMENGELHQQLVVWERSSQYRNTLASFLNDYGPLSDVLVTITRNGVAGSKDTRYSILPANPKMYANDAYPIDSTILENRRNLNIIGTLIMDKTANDINTFMQTGNFTMSTTQMTTQTDNQTLPTFNVSQATVIPTTSIPMEQPPAIPPAPSEVHQYQTPNNNGFTTGTPVVPTSVTTSNVSTINRPRRYY